jgi:pyruvate formate lyase activating enzyme
LTAIAEFLAGISPDIPWHVTASHEDYKMFGQGNTGAATLQRAASIGRASGLHYVYAGNLPGQLGKLEDTHCPKCGAAVVERRGFQVLRNRLKDGRCPDCTTPIAGLWSCKTTSHQPLTTSHGELCSPPCG